MILASYLLVEKLYGILLHPTCEHVSQIHHLIIHLTGLRLKERRISLYTTEEL